MYTPAQFEETRPTVLQELMRTHPLATLVAMTPHGLAADHIPLVFHATDGSPGVLRGHVARANPIWRELEPGAKVLAIFQGPSHYVSPNWYPAKKEHGKVVPTWNYVVVHVHGAIDWQHDPAWLRALLEALTNGQEAGRAEPWKVTDAPPAYTDRMLASIVGFEIAISAITGKWKLSQNRSEADRAGVAAGLAAEGTAEARRMTELLRGGVANADGVYEPFPVERVPWESYSQGTRFGSQFRQLGQYGGGTHVGVCMEVLEAGKRSNPAHYHMLEEEHLLVLEGSMTLRLGEASYRMSAGDYVCFPAGQKAGHALVNDGDAPCRYLIIGERNPNDVIVYTDSGRVGVRLTGEGYRKSDTLDYWAGEDTGPP